MKINITSLFFLIKNVCNVKRFLRGIAINAHRAIERKKMCQRGKNVRPFLGPLFNSSHI